MSKGAVIAVAAYTIWGISPVYWKLIQEIPAIEIVGHRMAWSFLFVLVVVLLRKEGKDLAASLKRGKVKVIFLISAVLLSVNWLVYIWAVNSGFIVDASLGYFINPLVNVLFGVVFLKERLRTWQWISVGLAGLGVVYLGLRLGSIPWIGLVLALTFGLYGLIRKKAAARSTHGFTLETGYMFIPALIFLLGLEIGGNGQFGQGDIQEKLMLASTGAFTAIPLVMFGTAVKLITLSTLGFLQYIAPTLQFIIGVFVYGEGFSVDKLVGYGVIWVALAIFSVEGVVVQKEMGE